MAPPPSWTERRSRLADRAVARVTAQLAGPRVPRLGASPEPRGQGRFARGRQLIAGKVLIGGEFHEIRAGSIWDLPVGPTAEADRQGMIWLDDLAAVGDAQARKLAQAWVAEWVACFGRGRGPGWRPDIAGQRVLRWASHSAFLRRGLLPVDEARLARSLTQQIYFLARRWRGAPAGLPRIEALAGLIHGGLAVEGLAVHAGAGIRALARDCELVIDAGGAIPSRNPEELSEILFLLTWTADLMTARGQPVPAPLTAAIRRVAPVLRHLRMADGGLARFHGGSRGLDGRLDAALAASATRTRPAGLAMGYARLAAGRTVVVMDAATPPRGAASVHAHAATLAFEMTSGRRPVIVNCGPGEAFGFDWRRAGRATASQSTLGIDGYSSSRFGSDGDEMLTEAPDMVPGESATTVTSHRFGAAHNGWQRTHGLTHARTLDLTLDGRALTGEELLIALSPEDQAIFDLARRGAPGGLPWSLRFHLHPEAEAVLDLGGKAVSIALRSGEVWVLRQEGAARMALAPSVYLEQDRSAPRATTQVVLSGAAMAYATRVRWSLAKAQDTPNALRDLGPDSDPGAEEDAGDSGTGEGMT